MGAFGEKLRKQREQRGVALEAISNTTKISTRMLRALEDEQFDQLPGGVFNKGFVRAYARQIGLDEEETVTDYLAALRESQIQAQQILPDFRTPGTAKASPMAVPDPRPHGVLGGELAGDDGNNNGSHDLGTVDRRKRDRRNPAHREADPGDTSHQHALDPIPSSTSRALADNSARYAGQPSTSTRFFRNALAAALLLVSVGFFAVWNSHRHREAAFQKGPSSNQSASQVSAQPAAATPATAAAASPKSAAASPAATPSTRMSGAGRSSGAASAPPAAASVTNLASKPTSSPPQAKPPDVRRIAPAAKPPSTFTVLIRAEKTTWVSITSDGRPVAHETLIAPAHTSVRATSEIVVKAGNAAGISFLLNGKEIPAAGNEGEVKTYIFDATGVRVLPQTQVPTPNH